MKSGTRQALAEANARIAALDGRIAELSERLRRHDELFASYRTQFDTEPATMQARLQVHAAQQSRDAARRAWPIVALVSLVIAIVVAVITFGVGGSALHGQAVAAANSAASAAAASEVARRLDEADLASRVARAAEAAAAAGRASENAERAAEAATKAIADLGGWKTELHGELRADAERSRSEAARERTDQFAALATGLRDVEIPRAAATAASAAVAGAIDEARLKELDLAGLIERTIAANSAAGTAAASASAAAENASRAIKELSVWKLSLGDEIRSENTQAHQKAAADALERIEKLTREIAALDNRTRRLTQSQTQTAELLASLIERLAEE